MMKTVEQIATKRRIEIYVTPDIPSECEISQERYHIIRSEYLPLCLQIEEHNNNVDFFNATIGSERTCRTYVSGGR
jgi:hypothetical protein